MAKKLPVIYHEIYMSTVKEFLLGFFMDEIQADYKISDIFISGEKVIIKLDRSIQSYIEEGSTENVPVSKGKAISAALKIADEKLSKGGSK